MVTDLAGTGLVGWVDGTPGQFSAEFDQPRSIAADPTGAVYVSEFGNPQIRRIDLNGVVSTLPLTGGAALAIDSDGNLYSFANSQLLKTDSTGTTIVVAGNGTPGFVDGTGGASGTAEFYEAQGLAVAQSGMIYLSDEFLRVRRIDTDGNVTTLLTDGTFGNSSSAGASDAGPMNWRDPRGIAVDTDGTLYFTETDVGRIWKVDTAGNMTVLAGNGCQISFGFAGVGCVADGSGGPDGGASFAFPIGIALDGQGNLLVADAWANQIRKVDPAGNVTTLAGNGFGYDAGIGEEEPYGGYADGPGGLDAGTEFFWPTGVTVDAQGQIYVADSLNNRIRKLAPNGDTTTYAGNGFGAPDAGQEGFSYLGGGFADGPALPSPGAEFNAPFGVAVDPSGNVWVADSANNAIREIGVDGGWVTTPVGPDAGSPVATPSGIATDAQGNIYIADTGNSRVVVLDTLGNVTTLNGSATGLDAPQGVAVDALGNFYVADTGHHEIQKIDSTGTLTTIGGNGSAGYLDGLDGGTAFSAPQGVAVDALGNVYVADTGNGAIRRIDATGTVSTLAAGPSFSAPTGVAVDALGTVYVADPGYNRIDEIDLGGQVTVLAGDDAYIRPPYHNANGYAAFEGFANGTGGPNGTAEFNHPTGVAVDAAGHVFVADQWNNCIREISR